MKKYFIAFLIITGVLTQAVNARTIDGKVNSITDGDTIKILTADKQTKKIRLAQIDTPEKKQPWGQKAKQALSDKIYKKAVQVEIETTDRYGRLVGTVWYGTQAGILTGKWYVKAMPGFTANTLKTSR